MPSSAPSTAALPPQSRAARRRRQSALRMGLLALAVGGCVASLAHQALQADARDLVPQQSVALPAAAQALTLPSLTFKSSGAMPVQGRWLQFQRDLGAGTAAGRGMPPLAWQWGSQSGECQMAGLADAWRAQVLPSASAQLSCQAGHGQMALRLQQADPQGIRRWTGEIRLPGGQQFAVESLHELGGQARPEVRGYLIRQAGQPVAEVELAAAGPVIRLGEGVAPTPAAQSLWPSLLNLALWSPPAPAQVAAASS